MAFSRRLADRLRGREVEPGDPREARIFELVAMIEGQYPRATGFPDVFASLLAIHHAQERSIALLAGATPLPGGPSSRSGWRRAAHPFSPTATWSRAR